MPENLYRRGGIWWARVQVRGREVRKSLHTKRLDEARRRLKAVRDSVEHQRFHGEERHTWKAAVGKWTLELQSSVKPNTAKRYLCSLRQVATFLEPLFVDEIDRKRIAGLVSHRKAMGATNATIRRDLTAVSIVLAGTVAWGWREDNPAREWDRRAIKERRDPIILPRDEDIDFVIGLAPGNFAKMIRWAQFTGMREEECASLERPDVSLPRRAANLSKTKTNRPRSVPLDDRALGTLAGTVANLGSQWVFWHGQSGERYMNVASRFAELTRRAARRAIKRERIFRRFTFHQLRHWFAVDYLRRGGSIYDLQQILGHSSIKTTEIYLAFLTPEEAQKAKQASAQNSAQL